MHSGAGKPGAKRVRARAACVLHSIRRPDPQPRDYGLMRDGDVPPWWAGHQRILNARAVPERFTRCEPVPVRVRLRWADDGIEIIETRATAWTTPLVLVLVEDSRSVTRGVWVPAVDVTRLRPGPASEHGG